MHVKVKWHVSVPEVKSDLIPSVTHCTTAQFHTKTLAWAKFVVPLARAKAKTCAWLLVVLLLVYDMGRVVVIWVE